MKTEDDDQCACEKQFNSKYEGEHQKFEKVQ